MGAVRALALLITWAPALAAAADGPAAPAAPAEPTGRAISQDEEAALGVRLVKARELIAAHQAAKAISDYLDPVIGRYVEVYAASPKVVFCAREAGEAFFYLALVAAAAKDGAPARDTIVIGPNWADAYLLKGFAEVELKDLEAAQATLRKATALSPWNAQYLSELAYVTQQLGASAEALELYGSAQELAGYVDDPQRKRRESARACRGQGYALVELKRLDEAEARYQACIAIDPADKISPGEIDYIRQLRGRK